MRSASPAPGPADLSARDFTVAVAVSRFNEPVPANLLASARAAFLELGGTEEHFRVTWVPGAFELPQAVQRLAAAGQCDGILALGALVKGETLHFEVLAYGVTQALANQSTRLPVPLAYGLLTALTMDQARERAEPGGNNKGAEALRSLVEMIQLAADLP